MVGIYKPSFIALTANEKPKKLFQTYFRIQRLKLLHKTFLDPCFAIINFNSGLVNKTSSDSAKMTK